MRNIALKLMYNGTAYHGWQVQKNAVSVCETLQRALAMVCGGPVKLTGCGRTDAGVHARLQVCSFRAETALSCEELLAALRQYLPEDIGALALEEAEPRFHARLSCREKSYVYRIWNSTEPQVFARNYCWILPEALDIGAMEEAAALLGGEHDFSAFCANKHLKKSAVRNLHSVTITREGPELRLRFTGDGFLYHMVRILTGTLVEVGLHQREAREMPAILASRDRSRAGFTAPAKGLILWEVRY